MTHTEFILKYPDIIAIVRNVVFPYTYDDTRLKDSKALVEYMINKGEIPTICMKAVQDSIKLYDIDDDLFSYYKNLKSDLYILLNSINIQQKDKNI